MEFETLDLNISRGSRVRGEDAELVGLRGTHPLVLHLAAGAVLVVCDLLDDIAKSRSYAQSP